MSEQRWARGGRRKGGSRGVAALAAVVVTVSLLGVAEAGAQQNPPLNQPGVTDKEIRVGGVATVSNDPTGNTLGTAFDGVKAYFDYINATERGVYGRKLVLSSKRDDAVANNRQEVQGLITEDNVFAVLPVASDLFTGADLLVKEGIPTFGWDIQAEWGSEGNSPGPLNLFGAAGSFINFKDPGATSFPPVWLAKRLGRKRVGVIAFNVPQSVGCAEPVEKAFDKFGTAKVVFSDKSLAFGNADYSVQVAQMVEKKVDLVIPCIDANGAFTLGREMKKQRLDAPLVLANAYNQDRIQRNANVADGNYLYTFFTPFESASKPAGLKLYDKWIKKSGGTRSENSIYGWLNADLFVSGLKAAGPDFTRQKVIDAINQMKDYKAGGILPGVDWTKAHEEGPSCYSWLKIQDGKFKPVFAKSGKPFLCIPANAASIPARPEAIG